MYFEYTYLRGMPVRRRRRDPVYPLELWNQFQASVDGQLRTTNSCEGSQHAFTSLLTCSHPSIWRLIDAFHYVIYPKFELMPVGIVKGAS